MLGAFQKHAAEKFKTCDRHLVSFPRTFKMFMSYFVNSCFDVAYANVLVIVVILIFLSFSPLISVASTIIV